MIKFCCGREILLRRGNYVAEGNSVAEAKSLFEKDLTSMVFTLAREKFSLQSLQTFCILRIHMY